MKSDIAREPDPSTETYDALRARIRDGFDDLSPHLQRLARSALDEPNFFALNTVAVLAQHVSVQPSTLIRFAKEFGYGGFSQMQRVFRLRLIEGAPDKRAEIYENKLAGAPVKNMNQIFEGCIDELIASLESVREKTSTDDLARAVAMIKAASHVHIAGLRRARPIATYLAYGISRSEQHCSLLDFAGGMAEQQVVNMRRDDLLICVSFPPYTPAVLDVIRDAHLRRRPIIAITDSQESPLAKNSTLAFLVDNESTSQFKPISGAIGLVQALCIGLTEQN
ncbi:MurR/RpiR family transcriptional regulator [Candidatus Halocynthiibacter alkanivorans]|uniref:MurR/RpiR family transcriptional regulator n=1 Tax=Candidatus Halocynthiibacter alkanivorans TaxID=2267619 RepID=UPI000DF368BA|nr:MurR/RpiR family transcriptional regulator [Candidatus Halocynthiibacter alkanivorans]